MYSINAASSIRSNSDYNVSVSLHEGDRPSSFKIKLTGPEFEQEKDVQVQPSTTEIVNLKIPEILEGEYKITVQGVEGVNFKKTKGISYKKINTLYVFLQTDKATYKPGDLVRFRALFLDNNTRPAKLDHPIDLQIMDGDQNLLKHLKDIKIKNGVYSDSYQLTEFASLGNWELLIKNESENLQNKSFEVAKYVLPKFDVKIESPSDILIDDETIKVQVRSNYTYGKAVTGKAVILIESAHEYFYAEDRKRIFCEKTIDITGKTMVEFDMIKELNYVRNPENFHNPPLTIRASVEEELTGLKQETTQEITVHMNKFTVEGFEIPNTFHPENDTVIKVAVKKYDRTPVIDTKNPVTLIAESSSYKPSGDFMDVKILKFEGFLDDKGVASFTVKLPASEKATTSYSLKARYYDIENWVGHISQHEKKSGEFLDLVIETPKPIVYEDVNISLRSSKPLGSFVYHVVKNGEILKTERVNVTDTETSHNFTLKPTFSMMPYIKIVAFIYRNGDLNMKEANINFEKDLENKIEIETCEETKPGKEVELTLKTHENSFVGLLGVDQSVLILKQGNDLEVSNIFDQIQSNGYGGFRGGCFPPFSSSSIITITNADFSEKNQMRFPRSLAFGAPPIAYQLKSRGAVARAATNEVMMFDSMEEPAPTPQIRKEFPETWIWEDIETTESTTKIKRVVPDTMTSWVLTGFALNDDIGLGITKDPTKLKVFQPFFVSMNLPYAVKRGEVISVPVTIFNYMENEVTADVTLENEDDEFDFFEDEEDTKSISVLPEMGKNVVFKIRAKKVGQITLKVKAISPVAGDIVHQMLRVEAEGVTEHVNRAVLLNLSDKTEQQEKIDIDIPEDAVPDSEKVELSLVGDILGPTIRNLDQLVRIPYGCGEQNMVNFVPNILVLRYLGATNQLDEAIQNKAKKFLEIGYERQLSYKHRDGSYSAFGPSCTNCGSTWLTAYVARSFHQARPYTFIEMSIIESALDFLISTQQGNGSFKENGKLFDHRHASGEDKGVALTAFVLLAFLENKESLSKYEGALNKGLKFLADNIETINDLYAESISTYALSLAKHELAGKALALLENKATNDGDKKSWIIPKKMEDIKHKIWCWWPQTHDVEVTSYAFLSFSDQQSVGEMLPTIKWLISQRNSRGGFSSTQDTVVGLQALTKFAEKIGGGNAEMDIDFKDDQGASGTFNVCKDNSLVLQSHVLSNRTKIVDVLAKGKGSCLLQISYKFNLSSKDEKPSFTVKPSIKEQKGDLLIVNVVVNYISKESNMAVLEVSLPSGYIADKDAFEKLLLIERVKKVETKNEDTIVVIYFDSLTKADVSLDVCAMRTHQVEELKKSSVLIYDYYDNTKAAKEFYDMDSTIDSAKCAII
ncbi:CD109.2 family protein [Megaselia abdita]